jgi:hypothetical protein
MNSRAQRTLNILNECGFEKTVHGPSSIFFEGTLSAVELVKEKYASEPVEFGKGFVLQSNDFCQFNVMDTQDGIVKAYIIVRQQSPLSLARFVSHP